MHATGKSTFRLLEQFLYTIQTSSDSSLPQCIVAGPANTSSLSTLPLDKQSVSNGTTHICAIRLSGQWKLQGCSVNGCDELCIAPRGKKSSYVTVIFFSSTCIGRLISATELSGKVCRQSLHTSKAAHQAGIFILFPGWDASPSQARGFPRYVQKCRLMRRKLFMISITKCPLSQKVTKTHIILSNMKYYENDTL